MTEANEQLYCKICKDWYEVNPKEAYIFCKCTRKVNRIRNDIINAEKRFKEGRDSKKNEGPGLFPTPRGHHLSIHG